MQYSSRFVCLISDLFCSIKDQNHSWTFSLIERLLVLGNHQPIPVSYLEYLHTSIKSHDSTLLSKAFTSGNFIGKDGSFLWVAPYRFHNLSQPEWVGIMGKVLPITRLPLGIPEARATLPVEITFSFGPGPELDETSLMCAKNWDLSEGGLEGPDFLNLSAEQITIAETLHPALIQIFTPKSAALLTSWTSNRMLQNSILFHLHQLQEFARAKAQPLTQKIRKNIDQGGKVVALEEWRNDGIALKLAIKTLTPSRAAPVIAALLCKRLGSLFSGGSPSLSIHLDRLLKSGLIAVTNDLKLDLQIQTITELPRVIEATVSQTEFLTHHPFSSFLGDSLDLSENLIRLFKQKKQRAKTQPRYLESVRLESNPTP